MKKVFVSLVVLMFAASAFAATSPIDKGSMILEGNVYFQSASGDLYKNEAGDAQTVMAFMPSVGYFVAPSIMVGATVEFAQNKQGDNKLTTIGIGPMVGYYFNMDAARTEVKGAIYPYIKAFFMYNSEKHDNGTTDYTNKVTTFGGQGGIVYMLSNAVAADISVKFESDSYKPDGADKSTTGTIITFGAGFTAFMWN